MSPFVPKPGLTGSAKLKEVTRLVDTLTQDLEKISLLSQHEGDKDTEDKPLTDAERDTMLEELKVYGRDPVNSDAIFTREGIETLTRYAFDGASLVTSRNALRCLANAMLLKPKTRQIFLDLGYGEKACDKLKNDNRDDEFLVSRVVFLTTYESNVNIVELIDEFHIAENICLNISRHTRQYNGSLEKSKRIDPMEDMALAESLKLMFNLTHFCPERAEKFSPALSHILMILTKRPISGSKPLDPPIANLVNALLNLPLESKDSTEILFPKGTVSLHTDRLIELLDKSTKKLVYSDEELETLLSPLLIFLRKVYEVAPNETKSSIQNHLLPTIDDRQQPLGRGESLSARTLRLSTNPTAARVKDAASALLFDLSGKDASTFVQNVGYGFASGFLFQHNIKLPEKALEAAQGSSNGNSGARSSENGSIPVNPITGQALKSEPVVDLPPMTEAEKEREAERLFVLFERLKKTGVMDMVNPVETAFREGRFEELDDDANSE